MSLVPPASQQRQFVETLHDSNAVVWEMDARTWRFTYVSPRAEYVFGYGVDEWLNDPTFWQDKLVAPEDRDWCVSFCSTATRECRNHAFLYRARAADGRQMWVADLVRVIPDGTGAAKLMRGVMLDVTEEMTAAASAGSIELDYDAPRYQAARDFLSAA